MMHLLKLVHTPFTQADSSRFGSLLAIGTPAPFSGSRLLCQQPMLTPFGRIISQEDLQVGCLGPGTPYWHKTHPISRYRVVTGTRLPDKSPFPPKTLATSDFQILAILLPPSNSLLQAIQLACHPPLKSLTSLQREYLTSRLVECEDARDRMFIPVGA